MKKITMFLIVLTLMVSQLLSFTGVCAAETFKDPVLHLKFEDNFDSAISNSYSGAKSGKVSFTEGVIGKGVELSGGYIDLKGTEDLDYAKGLSVSLWLKINYIDNVNAFPILCKLDSENYEPLVYYFGYAASLFQSQLGFGEDYHNNYFEFPDDPNNYTMDRSQLVEKWAHIVVTFDGKEEKLYLDGELLHQEYMPDELLPIADQGVKTSTPYRVGKSGNGYFNGFMDEYKLFDYAISEDTVTQLYNEAFGQYTGKIELKVDDPNIYVNGAGSQIDADNSDIVPTIIDGRTLVPIRAIMEGIGGEIGWDAAERRVDLKYKGTTLNLWLDNKNAKVNGQALELDVPPMTIEGRTMLPLRFVGEKLGMKVEWIAATRSIILNY